MVSNFLRVPITSIDRRAQGGWAATPVELKAFCTLHFVTYYLNLADVLGCNYNKDGELPTSMAFSSQLQCSAHLYLRGRSKVFLRVKDRQFKFQINVQDGVFTNRDDDHSYVTSARGGGRVGEEGGKGDEDEGRKDIENGGKELGRKGRRG